MLVNKSWRLLWATSLILVIFLFYTGIFAYERLTWLLEVLPVLIIYPLLFMTYRHYPLTKLLYIFIFLHALILIVGGLYTYARVPWGFEIQKWFGLSRNPYDKLGHFFQGLVPALAAYEILVRGHYVKGKKMLYFIVCCIVLAISATYELLEWLAALMLGQGADEFLGMQGDPWDTQSDMFCALLGAISALCLFSPLQLKQIRNMHLYG